MQILAGTAILDGNKILLLQNIGSEDQHLKWGLPAGHGEPGESAEETAIRETKEETNLDVELIRIIQVSVFNYRDKDYVCVVYLAKAKDLNQLKIQKEEVADYVWATLNDIENDKYAFRKKFLKEPTLMAFKKDNGLDSFKIYKVE